MNNLNELKRKQNLLSKISLILFFICISGVVICSTGKVFGFTIVVITTILFMFVCLLQVKYAKKELDEINKRTNEFIQEYLKEKRDN